MGDLRYPKELGSSAGGSLIVPFAVFGPWAIDGDGAETNGAGLVGAKPVLTQQATTYAKVSDNGVFSNLAVTAGQPGYTNNYQMFPDVPVAGQDYVYFGADLPFIEIAWDLSVPAIYNSTGVLQWSYWDESSPGWTSNSAQYDGTHASTHNGSLAFTRDGAAVFYVFDEWGLSTIDGQSAYWLRCGIANGKAANMTQIPRMNSKRHEIVTPYAGWVCPVSGNITGLRWSNGAINLNTGQVRFVLFNYTRGTSYNVSEITLDASYRSGRQTFTPTWGVTAGDVFGCVCVIEDGTNEPFNVFLELFITPN